jgi:hypothetical protein
MAEKIRLKISPTVSRFVRPGVTIEEKLSGLAGSSHLEPFDRVTLLFCLARGTDIEVTSAAGTALASLPDDVLMGYVTSADAHPSVLDALAGNLHDRPAIVAALLAHSMLSDQAREYLQRHAAPVPEAVPDDAPSDDSAPEDDLDSQISEDSPDSEDDLPAEEIAEIDEEDEQYLSKYKIAQIMGISEKIKMALSGDKEWRAILVKDGNKLVSGSVIKNPRISDAEILRIIKLGVQNDEVIRLICANREWIKNYQIRKALIDCPKTPMANSLRYLGLLQDKDLAKYAKSRNISSVLSTQAKRMLLAKQKKR